MGNCRSARLLTVIREVTLGIKICFISDNGYGRFICTNGTVRTKAPKFTADGSMRSRIYDVFFTQGSMGNIIDYTNGEAVF